MIKIEKTKLAWKLTLPFQHHDERGSTHQMFDKSYMPIRINAFEKTFQIVRWHHENIIVENYGSLRGLHWDNFNWKLIACLSGRIILALADPDTFETEIFDFSQIEGMDVSQILVPPWIANGHVVLSPTAIFHYLWSEEYRPQSTLKWNDSRLNIDWKVKKPIISERDR
jgi:dTDP-4-dehydrorhamnose 3,5-epimerase